MCRSKRLLFNLFVSFAVSCEDSKLYIGLFSVMNIDHTLQYLKELALRG